MIRAFLQAGLPLDLGARGGDDLGAEGFRDLDRGDADAAGRAVHKHPLPPSRMRPRCSSAWYAVA